MEASDMFPSNADRWQLIARHVGNNATELQCEAKWNIIYHDFVGARIAIIGVASITCVGIGIAVCAADYYINGKLTTSRGIQLQKDFEEV